MHQVVNIENLITKKKKKSLVKSEVSDIANLPLVAKSVSLETGRNSANHTLKSTVLDNSIFFSVSVLIGKACSLLFEFLYYLKPPISQTLKLR